jgi:hypothetical protein
MHGKKKTEGLTAEDGKRLPVDLDRNADKKEILLWSSFGILCPVA